MTDTILTVLMALLIGTDAVLLIIAWLGKRALVIIGEPFVERLEKLIGRGEIERACKLCDAAPAAPLTRGAKFMIENARPNADFELLTAEARVLMGPHYGEAPYLRLALLNLSSAALVWALPALGGWWAIAYIATHASALLMVHTVEKHVSTWPGLMLRMQVALMKYHRKAA